MDDESFLQVYESKVPRQLFAWATILPDVGCGECRAGYFIITGNQQQCKEPSQKPIPCLTAIQWHGGKEGSQLETDMDEMQYIMSGVASVVDSDGRCLTRGSGF
uniref:RING-type E3 ubiquitin transferase n=1 Tax=Mesocestoides corti TaxID=53468 RepID=A0A5K3F772_MESCO